MEVVRLEYLGRPFRLWGFECIALRNAPDRSWRMYVYFAIIRGVGFRVCNWISRYKRLLTNNWLDRECLEKNVLLDETARSMEKCRRAMSVAMMLCRVFFPQRSVATATSQKITWRLQPDRDRVILVRKEICDDWTCQAAGERLQSPSDTSSSKLFSNDHWSSLNQKSLCMNNKFLRLINWQIITIS